MRGRPSKPLDDAAAPKLRFWRDRFGLTQGEVGEKLKLSQPQIRRLETGENPLSYEHAKKLAEFWNLSPSDLYAEGPFTAPLRYRIGSRFNESGHAPIYKTPYARVPVPYSLVRPHECFAADVGDNSADRIFRAGSTLFVRNLEFLTKGLRQGDRVVVALYETNREDGTMAEVLAGILTPTALGDLLVVTRSSNREVPPAIVLRETIANINMSMADRQQIYVATEKVDYEPDPGDSAEVLGRIEMAQIPG